MLKLDSTPLCSFKDTRKFTRERNFYRRGNRLQMRNRFLDVLQKARGDCRSEERLVGWRRKTGIDLSTTEELRKHRTVRSMVLTHQANQQILDVNGVGAALSRYEPCDENYDS